MQFPMFPITPYERIILEECQTRLLHKANEPFPERKNGYLCNEIDTLIRLEHINCADGVNLRLKIMSSLEYHSTLAYWVKHNYPQNTSYENKLALRICWINALLSQ